MPSQLIENPQTIGEHLRNRRMELKLRQKEVAKIIGVATDSITYWENGRFVPQIQYYPKLIEFLGFNPFITEIKSIGGQIKRYRIVNGLSYRRLAKMTGFDPGTLAAWEENILYPSVENRMKLMIFDIVK